jgi:hypothetical protein
MSDQALSVTGALLGSTVQATGNLYGTTGLHTLNAAGNGWNHTINRNSGNPTANLPGGITSGNITTTGYLRGPSTFTIDPATHGDDTGTLVIAGNLQVDGTTTTVNSTTVAVSDLNFTVAKDAANAAAANNAGLTVAGADAQLKYLATGDKWTMNKPLDVSGTLHVNQANDSNGIKIFGYDDRSAYSGNIYIDGSGNLQIRQTHGAGSGYVQIHAETYLELGASGLVYTSSQFRIYDAGSLSIGSGGDYKIKHNATADNLIIHTDDNKGITIDNAGNVAFSETVTATGLTVNKASESLANQPSIISTFDSSGTDGLALISIEHLTNSGASALGAGLRFQVGDGATGTADKQSYIFQRGGGQLPLVYIADKSHEFYVDHHDNNIDGTSYSDYGTLALTLNEAGNVVVPLTLDANSVLAGNINITSNQIQAGYDQNSDNLDIWINYTGYLAGTNHFRDFRVGNGKQAQLFFVDGSAGSVSVTNSLAVGGGITAGAAGISTQDHRVPTGTGYITYSPSNQTADVLNIRRYGTVQQKFDQYGVTFPAGNVGVGINIPTATLHARTTNQAATTVAQLELATTVNANPSHINQKFSSGAGWIAMIQAEQRAGGQYGALNFWTANNGNPAQKMALNFAGDLSVGDEGVQDSPHPLHKKVEVTATALTSNAWSSAAGSNGGYDVSNNDTAIHQNRGSISAAGYYNHHVAHFSLRGNFAANTWYPFTTRTQLQAWVPGAGGSQDTGMPMYFRVYTYDVSAGGGDYLSHRLTDRFWFTSYASNSNQRHQIALGAAMGHAPNSGAYTDHKDYGNNPIQVSLNHRLGSDSYYSASQTFDIWFNAARTGLDGTNAKQVEIYAYIG